MFHQVKKIALSLLYGVALCALLTGFSVKSYSQDIDPTYQRIISTDAGVTDALIALGEADKLVGIDVTSVVPSSIRVARLGYHRALSAEGILSLNPDLIIGSEHMGPPEMLQSINKANLRLVQLPVARNAQTLKNNIMTIGQLLGKEAQASDLVQQVTSALSHVLQHPLAANNKVAFLLQMNGRGLRLAGKSTTGNDIINMLGAKNLGQHNGYQAVSSEALLSMKPDVIIVASENLNESPKAILLASNPMVQHTPAAKNGMIIEVDAAKLVAGISLSAINTLAKLADQFQ